MNKMKFQHTLLISTALPIAIVAAATAQARDVVVPAPVAPATSVSGTSVNAAIVAAITAPNDPNLKVTVPSASAVTGSSITLNPSDGQGDGKVELVNDGRIGAVDATTGAVTDAAGVVFNGRPAAGGTNIFAGTNNGLIAGGLRAQSFGGAVTITNAGAVHNGITATGQGDVSVTTTGAGVVRSGSVVASSSNTVATSAPVAGMTTTTQSGGKATIVQAGDVADAEDSVRGNVSASGLAGADVTVSAKARAISASAGGVVGSVNGSNAVVEGTKTTTTSRSDTTRGGGAAKVTLGENGDVASVSANGIGGATAGINGNVVGGVNAAANGFSTTSTTVSVIDGTLSNGTTKSTSTAVGKSADATIGEEGNVGGSLTVIGQGGASATVAGTVGANVSLNALATNTVNDTSFSNASSGTGFSNASTSNNTSVAAGGVASGTVAASGLVEGNLTAVGESVVLANAGTIEGNVSGAAGRVLNNSSSKTSSVGTTSATLNETTSLSETATRNTTTTGTASFANAAGGQVHGSVALNAGGDVTYNNAGVVFRATTLTSQGTDVVTTTSNASKVSTAIATPPAANTVTSTSEGNFASSTTRTGGNVTGTYGNANGTLNFGVNGDGSVFQAADKASNANVSGVVYGRVSSQAGSANSQSQSQNKSIEVASAGNGTRNLSNAFSDKSTTNAGGDSSVTVSGKLATGEAGVTPALYSSATGNSAVTVSGTVEGDVTSQAYAYDTANAYTRAVSQTIRGGVARTDSLTETSDSTYQAVGGSAAVDIAATGKVATTSGDVSAYGRTGASVTVAKGGAVGGTAHAADVYATADGYDYATSDQRTFTRKTDANSATGSIKQSSNYGTNAGVGDATVTIAGTVAGNAAASTTRGKATTTITGTIGGDARAIADNGFASQSATTTDYAGNAAASSSTNFFGLAPNISKQVSSFTNNSVGGVASVVVNTASDLQKLDKVGVAGSVYAQGLAAASATIAAGSKVGGDVEAVSSSTNQAGSSTTLYNGAGQATESQSSFAETLAGGDASVTIGAKSQVGGSVFAEGDKSASIGNAGAIAGSVYADALHSLYSETTAGTNLNNVGLRTEQTNGVYTGVGGTASVTNAAGALIKGGVGVAGATGTVTNAGGIAGSVILGRSVDNYRVTQVDTVANTVQTVTPAESLTAQTYTLDQNNFLGGGVLVTGAIITDPFGREGEPDIKTSAIKATINLNGGSVTLGNIEGQRDQETGAFLTDTTLNFTGAGFLGADILNLKTPTSPNFIPEAVLSKEAQELGFGVSDTGPVRILGVNAVNKTGTGTFVLELAPYALDAAPTDLNRWSADVGAINVSGGELQIAGPAYDPAQADGDYIGIQGDINVTGGSLVFGRRTRIDGGIIGGSIVTGGAERIIGVHVVLDGDYTQSANGTTVVGVSPSLVRSAPVTIGTANGGSEVLGPIQAGANVPFFTTAANGFSDQSTPSRIDVTGKVTLAGNVLVDVTRDAIYSAGDGYTLFTYGDAASTVSTTVGQSISSPFVTFELKNNTTAKTVDIVAKRNGYATVATNPNAASAASALDALIPTLVKKITDDAAGGSVFTTVSEIGLVQDAANIVSGLDWRLSQAGAAQVFNELSSAEIYGSLAAIEQNSALTESFETESVIGSGKSGLGLWINPVGRFARYGGTKSGASKIRDNSYGGAFGLNLGYAQNGSLGIGFAYAEHDITARGTPEKAKAKTYSLGINWQQGFGPIQAAAQFVYGFSDFDVSREMTILDRTAKASFKGREWNGNVELGYDVLPDSSVTVLPYGKLALRHWTLGGFTEKGAAGIGLTAGRDSKTVFVPELGVRLATDLVTNDDVTVRPFGKLSYTFQGDIGSRRAFTFAAGGSSFDLKGVDPKGFGSVDAGISALFRETVGVYVQGGFNFGGSQKGAEVRGGVNVRF